MEDIDRMEEYISEFLNDERIHNELPIFWEIMQRLKIDETVNGGNNDDILSSLRTVLQCHYCRFCKVSCNMFSARR